MVTGEVVVVDAEVLNMVHLDGVQLGGLQDMVTMETNVLDAVRCVELELSDRVDLVVHDVETGDLTETTESVRLHNSKVRLLNG